MPFIASNGLTEAGTAKTIAAGGMTVHYHDVGAGEPVLLIHGRYDRMVAFEVSIAILNHIADSRLVLLNNCGHWPPFEKPAEWTAQVLAFLRGY